MWPGWSWNPWLSLQNPRISNLAFKPESRYLDIQLEFPDNIKYL